MKSILVNLSRLTIALFVLFIITITANAQDEDRMFFVFLNPNPDAPVLEQYQLNELQKAHLVNVDSLYTHGNLIAAGPFEGDGGLFILVANDFDNAYQLLKSDPVVQADRFITELFPFTIEYGNICEIKNELDMKDYQLVRFIPFPMIFETDVNTDEIKKKHHSYYENINDSIPLLLEGSLGNAGKILIFNSQDPSVVENIIQQDPLIINRIFAYEIRTLWIARETFCDQE
jgi:uncharacterized protein YciI